MEILKEEEQKALQAGKQRSRLLSEVLEHRWQMGTFWYSLALDSPTGLFQLFYDHIQPRFTKDHVDNSAFFKITMSYWTVDAATFIRAKMKDKEDYDIRLRAAFED